MYQTNVTDTFLIDDLFVHLLEALRHHQEQTRPIEGTTLAIEKLQAMTAKTTAERVAAMRAARDAAGLKRLELYAHTGDCPAIKALAEKLQARRQRSDKREPANAELNGARTASDLSANLWRCTVCGRIGTVGRCCGEETREPVRAPNV